MQIFTTMLIFYTSIIFFELWVSSEEEPYRVNIEIEKAKKHQKSS